MLGVRAVDGRIDYASTLIDLWKLGLKDCFGEKGVPQKRFQEVMQAYSRGITLVPCDSAEARWLIRQGLRIARVVGTPMPREFEELGQIYGDINSVVVEGSLYKCFECEKGQLPAPVVSKILRVAKQELAQGIAGTPDETILFFVCEMCHKR
ncbi:hypothetical protein HY642_06610 [Candidatus Woesearchaeota archaeon]|nr:hypothetical protein [Candidatus Woesearchaeota archaeon]